MLRLGLREIKKAQSLTLFQQGTLSLWKAARLAGVSLRALWCGIPASSGTDIVLRFGSRGTFKGNTIGTISCDETSLVRGDEGVTCPNL